MNVFEYNSQPPNPYASPKFFSIIEFYVHIPSHNFLFLNFPKNACSSIRVWIIRNLLNNHSPLPDDIHKIKLPMPSSLNNLSSIKNSFCVVRNPYTRLYSCWKNKIYDKNAYYLKSFKQNQKINLEGVSFDRFVDIIHRLPRNTDEVHYAIQSYILKDIKNILRFENLQEEFSSFVKGSDELKMFDPTLGFVNKSLTNSNKVEIKKETREKIYEIYEEDFLNFGYDREF